MADRMKVLKQYANLPAFRGIVPTDIEIYLDMALQAVEAWSPKKVKMKSIPSSDNARYMVPDDARTLLGAFVTDTNVRIEMREETNPDGERTYLLLQIQVPSWIDLVRDDDDRGYQSYPTPYARGYRYGTYAGSGYETHDLEYTVPLTIEDIRDPRQLLALRYYAEAEAYQFQATKTSSLSDVTDREASGASTTLRRSQSGNAFQKLSDKRMNSFKEEAIRPYWTRDNFGLTEYLWSERHF